MAAEVLRARAGELRAERGPDAASVLHALAMPIWDLKERPVFGLRKASS